MHPTDEQWKIINAKQKRLVVIAYAGSGKTSTLVQYARANPDRRMLYIAYNKAICEEAQTKFPASVTCRTSHQLAHAAFGKRYRHKFIENLRLFEVVSILGNGDWQMAKDACATLETFLCSGDQEIVIGHTTQSNKPSDLSPPVVRYKTEVVIFAAKLWAKMKDEDDPFQITHDGILKLYQLSKPNLAIYYSAILFDEAQDANPVTTAFIEDQACISIFVGDRHQQIYRYRGADNALDSVRMEKATRLYLSNSFRFGPQVAMVANAILALKGETVPLVGRGQPGKVCMHIPEGLSHIAVLHRTVIGAISTAIDFAQQGKKIFWVGGIKKYGISDIADVYRLASGGTVKSKKIRDYGSIAAYKNRAVKSGDRDMLRILKIVEIPGIADLLRTLSAHTVEDEAEADITVATAHGSKGLEWLNVALASDFPDIFMLEGDNYEDELNLLYVAATRAREVLVVNAIVEAIMRLQLMTRRK